MSNTIKKSGPILTARIIPLLAALVGTYAHADAYSTTLADSRWHQLVFPVQTSSHTVGDLLGDDLPADEYGSSWIIFTYDAEIGSYVDPGIDGIVNNGSAFWIMQVTGVAVTLAVSPDAEEYLGMPSSACASPYGCAEVALTTSAAGTFQMVGAPFAADMALSDITITTTSMNDVCTPTVGCDLGKASGAGLVANQVAYYSPASGSYTIAQVGDVLSSWQGFWTKTLDDNNAKAVQMLLPDSRLCS